MAKGGGKLIQTLPRPGRRLGIKIPGGGKVKSGNIVVRQESSKFKPGVGTKMGKDFTIMAIKDGIVKFRDLKGKKLVEVA